MKKLEIGQLVVVKSDYEDVLSPAGLARFKESFGQDTPIVGRIDQMISEVTISLKVVRGLGFVNNSLGGDGYQYMVIDGVTPIPSPEDIVNPLVTVHLELYVTQEQAQKIRQRKAKVVINDEPVIYTKFKVIE